jgi:hypothetical protein
MLAAGAAIAAYLVLNPLGYPIISWLGGAAAAAVIYWLLTHKPKR